jgi:hypothetical protein
MVQVSTCSKFDYNFKISFSPLSACAIIFINKSYLEILRDERKRPSSVQTLPPIICRKTILKMGFLV